MTPPPACHCSGQVLPEYALACAVLALALFVPWNGQRAIAVELAASLFEYLRGVSFVTSIL